mmetsp:Transcript_76857/g.215633  ORF Transcript_76857/g.215633 Transcript_76857/m.215633 type:complete len:273 (+) Transcript_76857:441-1259(+)
MGVRQRIQADEEPQRLLVVAVRRPSSGPRLGTGALRRQARAALGAEKRQSRRVVAAESMVGARIAPHHETTGNFDLHDDVSAAALAVLLYGHAADRVRACAGAAAALVDHWHLRMRRVVRLHQRGREPGGLRAHEVADRVAQRAAWRLPHVLQHPDLHQHLAAGDIRGSLHRLFLHGQGRPRRSSHPLSVAAQTRRLLRRRPPGTRRAAKRDVHQQLQVRAPRPSGNSVEEGFGDVCLGLAPLYEASAGGRLHADMLDQPWGAQTRRLRRAR